jgi:enterochelin esterase-like enzyme
MLPSFTLPPLVAWHADLPTARDVRRALEDAGRLVDYREVPEGHSAVTWRTHLGEVLVDLFGRR